MGAVCKETRGTAALGPLTGVQSVSPRLSTEMCGMTRCPITDGEPPCHLLSFFFVVVCLCSAGKGMQRGSGERVQCKCRCCASSRILLLLLQALGLPVPDLGTNQRRNQNQSQKLPFVGNFALILTLCWC